MKSDRSRTMDYAQLVVRERYVRTGEWIRLWGTPNVRIQKEQHRKQSDKEEVSWRVSGAGTTPWRLSV